MLSTTQVKAPHPDNSLVCIRVLEPQWWKNLILTPWYLDWACPLCNTFHCDLPVTQSWGSYSNVAKTIPT